MSTDTFRTAAVAGAWVLGIVGGLYALLSFAVGGRSDGSERRVYKTVGNLPLTLAIYRPNPKSAPGPRPCVIWFFGGGFESGAPAQYSEASKRLAKAGIVAISADYRVRMRHGAVTPFEAVKDARSAVRWVRAHADELQIDPRRIATGGGSSGGHLAIACATLDGPDEAGDDLSIDPKPAALILFNPLVDFEIPIVRERSDDDSHRQLVEISPMHRISEPLPPALILHGTADRIIPIASVTAFVEKAKALGSGQIEFIAYPGKGHEFHLHGINGNPDYDDAMGRVETFLRELGWIGPSSAP